MAETNIALLDELEKSERKIADAAEADKEKALAVYWSILSDPSRTSKADREAFAGAMRVLGKNLASADDDSRIIEQIAVLEEIEQIHASKTKESREADAAALAFQTTRKEEIEKLNQRGVALRTAAIALRNQVESAADALADTRQRLEANAEAVKNATRFKPK